MEHQGYTQRELDHHFNDIKDRLTEIKTQVVKTNGRVTALERWKWIITGGLIVIGAMSLPQVSLIAKALGGL